MKSLFFFVFLLIGTGSFSQTYVPIRSKNNNQPPSVFTYYYKEGVSNRPAASIKFRDGFSFYLNAVCSETGPDGMDYEWCVRNEDVEDVAYMTVQFSSNNKIAKIRILKNDQSYKYSKYLGLFSGTYIKVKD